MALHYDITKVQESVSSDNLNYIIWTTVVLGMQNITEDDCCGRRIRESEILFKTRLFTQNDFKTS